MESENDKTTSLDFDDMLSLAGDCGRYQLMIFLLISLMQFVATDAYAINFIAGTMDHWCTIPQLASLNLSSEQMRQLSVPPNTSATG